MTCCNTIQCGFEISNHWFDPLGAAVQKTACMRNFYTNHPIAARFVTVSANTVFGVVKVFVLPFMSAIGLVVMPIIAAFKAYRGDWAGAKQWLSAWGFCLLAGVGVFAFVALSGFHMTLLQATAVVVTGTALSVIIHIWRVAKEPPAQH